MSIDFPEETEYHLQPWCVTKEDIGICTSLFVMLEVGVEVSGNIREDNIYVSR